MNTLKQSVLVGILAVLLLLTGCAVFTPGHDEDIPEEYQQTAVVIFEDATPETPCKNFSDSFQKSCYSSSMTVYI